MQNVYENDAGASENVLSTSVYIALVSYAIPSGSDTMVLKMETAKCFSITVSETETL